MKNILLKTVFVINLFLMFSCKAQTVNDYVNFYNELIPKLNTIIPNKSQFYGQNFSVFYNELQSKNINVASLSYDYKLMRDRNIMF